jgi:hypothetical protein
VYSKIIVTFAIATDDMRLSQTSHVYGVFGFLPDTHQNILGAFGTIPGALKVQFIYKPLNFYYDKS